MSKIILALLFLFFSVSRLTPAFASTLPGLTPLMNAAIENDIPAIESLIDAGAALEDKYRGYADPNGPFFYYYKYTALFFAIEAQNEDAVQLLVNKGANTHAYAYLPCYDPNNGTCDVPIGESPMPIPAFELVLLKRLPQATRLFLSKGEKVSMYWVEDFLVEKEAPFLKIFFEYGLDANEVVLDGSYNHNRMSHIAARNNQVKVLEILAENKANFEIKNDNSNTPLLSAIKSKRYAKDAISYLIGAHVNVDIQDSSGMSPLMLAVQTLNEELVQELIRAKASIAMKNNDGKTALQLTNCKTALYGCTKENKEKEKRIKSVLKSAGRIMNP